MSSILIIPIFLQSSDDRHSYLGLYNCWLSVPNVLKTIRKFSQGFHIAFAVEEDVGHEVAYVVVPSDRGEAASVSAFNLILKSCEQTNAS